MWLPPWDTVSEWDKDSSHHPSPPHLFLLSYWKGRGTMFPVIFVVEVHLLGTFASPAGTREKSLCGHTVPEGTYSPYSQAWWSSCSWNMKQVFLHAGRPRSRKAFGIRGYAAMFQGLPLVTNFYQVGASFQKHSRVVPSAGKQGFTLWTSNSVPLNSH